MKTSHTKGSGKGSITDAVVIGRNEGARLIACLQSLQGQVRRVVYVDSGSTDDSVCRARQLGVSVVELDVSIPFTAARARNAGIEALGPDAPEFVQFIDGDCELDAAWIERAEKFLAENPDIAVVCGRRRERHPEASVYNRLCDREWDTPVGEAKSCGGDALMRFAAIAKAGGYSAEMIAGEEPELCVRLRKAGWKIWRLDAEMTRHDAAITAFSQWARRVMRAGHAFAEGAARHGKPPERHWVQEMFRAMIWGAVLPIAVLVLSFVDERFAILGLVYPAQIIRMALRAGGKRTDWEVAFFNVLGKPFEAIGALQYWLGRLQGKRRSVIEYK